MGDDDRRKGERNDAVVLVVVESGDKAGRHGVTRNASERGLCFASQTHFGVNDRLEISVRSGGAILRTAARVVRVEETPQTETWRYLIAVSLEDTLPEELLEDGMRAAATLVRRATPPPPKNPDADDA